MCITKTVCCWHCGKWFKKRTPPDVYERCSNCGKGWEELSENQRRVIQVELKPLYPLMWLARHKCLNTMQICRLFNGFQINPKYGTKWQSGENPCYCKEQKEDGMVNQIQKCKINQCDPNYYNIFNLMYELEELGLVQSKKKKHYDTGKKIIDTYRFWFLCFKNYEAKILCETLQRWT